MIDKKVLLDTAILAKEKGFYYKAEYYLYPIDWTDKRVKEYEGYNVIHKNHNIGDWSQTLEQDYFDGIFTKVIPLPTQSLLQRWLREVYGIHVNPEYVKRILNVPIPICSYRVVITFDDYERMFINFSESYEEALEAGLLECLNRIS